MDVTAAFVCWTMDLALPGSLPYPWLTTWYVANDSMSPIKACFFPSFTRLLEVKRVLLLMGRFFMRLSKMIYASCISFEFKMFIFGDNSLQV